MSGRGSNVSFETVPTFIMDVSQDICELVLSRRLDLASFGGYDAAALAHRTFASRAGKRVPLALTDALTGPGRAEAFKEVLAFVLSWVDSVLQATGRSRDWLAVRQDCYGKVLAAVSKTAAFTPSEIGSVDELVVQRSAEYGPRPLDAGLALSQHLEPIYGGDALILGMSAGAYMTGAAVGFLKTMNLGDQ
jgi:hypothetical protein